MSASSGSFDLRLFRGEATDIDFAVAQAAREGWNTPAEHYEVAQAHEPDGCFVAEVGQQSVGMVTTTCYARTGWIGNLIVRPEFRRRGIGARLMRRAMDYLEGRGVATVRLEADPPGVPLYKRLGFVDEFESPRYRWQAPRATDCGPVERLTAAESPAVVEFDREHFGDDRRRLLSLLGRQAGLAFQVRQAGSLAGYVLATRCRSGWRIGPWVAVGRSTAAALLMAVVSAAEPAGLVISLPAPNTEGVALLESLGFEQVSACRRMVLGQPIGMGRPESIYCLANGAMG